MNKKILSLLVTILLVVSMFGCSKDSNSTTNTTDKENVSLTVWGDKEDNELLSEIIEGFKKEYANEADFDIKIGAVGEAECKDKILSDIHKAADVFAFADDQISVLAASGVLEPIYNADKVKEENVDGAVKATIINDKLYAYPMTADNGYFLYYNKKYLSESDVQTLEGILNSAERNNKKFAMDLGSGWYLYSFFGNTGLKMGLNNDGVTNYCNWNTNEGNVSGLDIAKYINNMAVKSSFINVMDDGLIKGMEDGSIIAGISGVWLDSKMKEILGDSYAAETLPTYNCAGKDIQMSTLTGYKFIGVNSYSNNKDWAMKLGEWITNENNQSLRFEKRGQGPANKNAAKVSKSPAIEALLKEAEFGQLQRIGANYWNPMHDFGLTLSSRSMSEGEISNLLNDTVKGITKSIIKE